MEHPPSTSPHRIVSTGIAQGVLVGIVLFAVYLFAPAYVWFPIMGLYIAWNLASLWSLRQGRCRYCGAPGGPVGGPPLPERAWYDPRPTIARRAGVTWVCADHLGTYLYDGRS